jgi:hypothetical protein
MSHTWSRRPFSTSAGADAAGNLQRPVGTDSVIGPLRRRPY